MKNLLLCLCLILCSLSAVAQYIPVPSGSFITLNGTWKFNPEPANTIFSTTAYQSSWKNIAVPGEWTMQGFTVQKGRRAAYQTTFSVPSDWKGKRIILRFDAVYSDAIVWINGKKAFTHTGGFNVFESDITPFLKKGQNLLTVGVINESIADTLSCGSQYAAHPLGGIPRKVTLFSVPDLHVSDLFITTDLDDRYTDATLHLELHFLSSERNHSSGDLQIDLLSPDGKIIASASKKIDLSENMDKAQSVDLAVSNPLKWNAEYPNLYDLRLKLSSASGEEIINRKVGFRKLEIAGNQLFLNGTPIKLHGVNRHEVHPLSGRSLNIDLWRRDAKLYKEANVNYIRTSHYPPAEEFIDLCDSIGLYVELENPLVWIGHKANLSLQFQAAWDIRLRHELIKTTAETITFYRNHPGIIIWSMANESAWTDNWRAVHKAADSLDATRPKSFHDQAYGQYNNYGSASMPIAVIHYPGPAGPAIADTFSRPLLFGEYCHLNTYNRQEIATDPGVRDAWGEGFHRMWEKMYHSKGCLGGALWSGIDDAFMLPEGKLVGYGEWGPIDGWRRKKPEYYHVMKTYSPVIIGNKNVNVSQTGEILLQVENRFDFTPLSACRFEWEVDGQKGNAVADIAPHNSGILKIGQLKGKLDGQILKIEIYSPYGRLIDEAEIGIGTIQHTNLPFGLSQPSQLNVMEDQSKIVISEGSVLWNFDRRSGKIAYATCGGDTILTAGAELMILPLHSQECKTEHSLDIPFINNTCSGWEAEKVATAISEDTVHVLVTGLYLEAEVTMDYCFMKGGGLNIKYQFTSSANVNPRQIGLVFTVPGNTRNLEWCRKGFWSSYPDWHIGRTRGKAVPFPPEAYFIKLGLKPEVEWKLDANSLGTNDFRSTKANIYWAALTSDKGNGIAVRSDGKQAFRSYVNGSSINFLVADYSNGGAEIFFASHLEAERKPLKTGDKFEGSVRLSVLTGENGR